MMEMLMIVSLLPTAIMHGKQEIGFALYLLNRVNRWSRNNIMIENVDDHRVHTDTAYRHSLSHWLLMHSFYVERCQCSPIRRLLVLHDRR